MTHLIAMTATPSPTPPATTGYDEDQVTPGVIGFVITAVFVLAVVVLMLDMVRRVRRARYRGEAQERIKAELATSAETSDAADDAAR